MKKITAEQFAHAFREVVREYPNAYGDAVHPTSGGCYYFRQDGTPSCVIGHALAKCGVEPFGFHARNNYESAADTVLDILGVYEVDVRWAAAAAQDTQDAGATWQNAGISFESALAESGKTYE